MDPSVRSALLAIGIAFCALFALMTLAVIADEGLDILTLISLAIVAMIAAGLIGAIRHPPEDR